MENVVKVAGNDTVNITKLATVITLKMRNNYAKFKDSAEVIVSAMGAQAVNNAVKAIIYANNFLSLDGINIMCIPTQTINETDGHTATIFLVRIRH